MPGLVPGANPRSLEGLTMSETAVEAPGAQDDTASGDAGTEGQHADIATAGSDDSDRAGTGRDGAVRTVRDGSDETARTERTIAAIRNDFKDERTKRQAAEKKVADIQAALDADKAERQKQMDALAIAFGLKSGDEPPDPAKLAEELKAEREKGQAEISRRDSALRERTIELAVLRNAARHGGNGDALLDSRSFMAKVNGLDPSAGGFADDLAEAIKAAVENGPQYKAAAPKADDGKGGSNGSGDGAQNGAGRKPPARSGGEHTTPGGQRQWTREEAAAVAKSDPKALMAAIEGGLLVDIGYPPQNKR